jgi:hypothetical protein
MNKKFVIIKDTREKQSWQFNKTQYCAGMEIDTLTTGDFTIRGLENILSLERKASTSEIATNLFEKRFYNELKRGQQLKYFFIVCEFTLEDVINFPYNSTIPNRFWKKLRMNSGLMLKKLLEIEIKYNAKIIFAGKHGQKVALAILKQMAELYAEKII